MHGGGVDAIHELASALLLPGLRKAPTRGFLREARPALAEGRAG